MIPLELMYFQNLFLFLIEFTNDYTNFHENVCRIFPTKAVEK